MTFSPDSRRIVSGDAGDMVKVWDVVTGREILTLAGHKGGAVRVAYSPDGRRVASAGGYDDQTVKVWDAANGQELLNLRGHDSFVEGGLAYSPDSRCIASAAGGNDPTLRVWDAVTGKELLTLRVHGMMVMDVEYSPDGRRLATASMDRTVKVWDALTGQELLTLRGHTSSVGGVAYSPDGHKIASASSDHAVKVWDGTPITPDWQSERHTLADRRGAVWQRQEAEDCEREKRWFAAVWHLDRLVEQNPDNPTLRARRDAARVHLDEEAGRKPTPELPANVFAK